MIISCRITDEFLKDATQDSCATAYGNLNKRITFKIVDSSFEDEEFNVEVLSEPFLHSYFFNIVHSCITDVKIHDLDAFL